MNLHSLKIAVISGDGIGREVVPEGVRILEAICKKLAINLSFEEIQWGNCDYYLKHGQMMPDDWRSQLSAYDAIFLGAVGWPAKVPDHISLWGSLLLIRREFDQYVNYRPVRLFDGVPCPLANMRPGNMDFVIIRENTEGEYTDIGGMIFAGTEREVVVQQSIHTRFGSERILRFAMDVASKTKRKTLTVATKSNGLAISMPWWDKCASQLADQEYPALMVDKVHIDALAAKFVKDPQSLNVVVATNLFGDILSDLGPACSGTLGLAPSGNINPTGEFPSLFEPVHGSAPDIAGMGIANPVGAIWSIAMLLQHSKQITPEAAKTAHAIILSAIEIVLRKGPKTRDLGGRALTSEMGKAIEREVTNYKI